MRNILLLLSVLFFVTTLTVVCTRNNPAATGINITHPFRNALFPPEFPAPAFEWWSEIKDSSPYEVSLFTDNKKFEIKEITGELTWKPDESAWDSLKTFSGNDDIHFTVKRQNDQNYAHVSFRLSKDTVGAPVLYRQMPIPFLVAEKQLDSMNFMLIDFGSKEKPHTAMKGFSVCGNCHSFTADGSEIGLDLDAGFRDKGGYFISGIDDTVEFNPSNFNSWSKMEKRRTFGLFSKLSPDGRYVVTTLKDRVLVKNFTFPPIQNVYYSQLFFPVNGHLGIYDRETERLWELPGANNPDYVHSNATWTPDGENIIFCRAEALPADSEDYDVTVKDDTIINEFVERRREFKYDLYIIPFNGGKGGEARPIEGASHNGKSNYFPAVSPDGKWLVYCQAENFMLLQRDSKLFIVPVEGGKAKELPGNFNSLNSWHAWSPNSRWLVYVSKGLSPMTDMFLTHIDENGRSSIPILIDRARVPYRVVNYPEFVNIPAGQTFVMDYDFVELAHIERAYKSGDWDKAKALFRRLETQEVFFFSEDYRNLAEILGRMGMKEDALRYMELARKTVDENVFSR